MSSSEVLKWFSKFADAYSTWTLVALGAFMCNLALWLPVAGWVLPFAIDLPPEQMKEQATLAALLHNLMLIALFIIQHSLMLRPWFKEAIKKQLPSGYIAPLYSLLSGAFLHLLMWQWVPMGPHLWTTEPFSLLFFAIYALRVIAFICCMAAVRSLPNEEIQLNEARAGNVEGPKKKELVLTFPYNVVRHPAMTMMMLALWSTPWLSMGHLVLSIALEAYIILAVLLLEEADLIKEFGDQYRQYQRRVPAFIPYRGTVTKLD